MRSYIVKCPNCMRTMVRCFTPFEGKLVPENGGMPVMTCDRCGQSYINIWASDEPAFLPYNGFACKESESHWGLYDDPELHQRWKASDNRLKDIDYALSLKLAGYPVPAEYFPNGFKLITEAEMDENSPYCILRAYACDRTDALEGRRDRRLRELHPNQTGFGSEKTREEVTKVFEAYRFLCDPKKRKEYDRAYMHIPADRKYKIYRPMQVVRSMPIG